MIPDTYPIVVGQHSTVFEFVSEGLRGRVGKMVIFSKTHLHDFYNLGFGDKNENTGDIDDENVTNNGDSLKVLSTVASTVYTFTNIFPKAVIFATGSTKSRTRLYRMGMSNNLNLIEKDFEVFGFSNGNWDVFQKHKDYDAFLVKRKNN